MKFRVIFVFLVLTAVLSSCSIFYETNEYQGFHKNGNIKYHEKETKTIQKNYNVLIKRLNYAGIDSSLLIQKIIPRRLQVALNSQKSGVPSLLIEEP